MQIFSDYIITPSMNKVTSLQWRSGTVSFPHILGIKWAEVEGTAPLAWDEQDLASQAVSLQLAIFMECMW